MAFEDEVFEELKNRAIRLDPTITGYDGDPNDGAAPPVIANARTITLYGDSSDRAWLRVTPGGNYIELANAEEVRATLRTQTAITFTVVPFDDPGGVAAPQRTFLNQNQVDDYLTSQSATGFYDPVTCHNTLPPYVEHAIVYDLQSGEHRPQVASTEYAFEFTSRSVSAAGSITMRGPSGASYDVVSGLSAVAINSYTAADRPSVTATGTPFTGLDLRGYICQLTVGGYLGVIGDNDDSTLTLQRDIFSDPTSGTLSVTEPAATLANTTNGTTKASNALMIVHDMGKEAFTAFDISDVRFDNKDADMGIYLNGWGFLRRSIFDLKGTLDSGTTPDSWGFQLKDAATYIVADYSFRAQGTSVDGSSIASDETSTVLIYRSFFAGGDVEDGMTWGKNQLYRLYSCTFDNHGVACLGGEIDLGSHGIGPNNWFRNADASLDGAIKLEWGASTYEFVNNLPTVMEFENNATNCLYLGDRCRFDAAQTTNTIVDGGGNTGYGIVIGRFDGSLYMNTDMVITGSLGDIRAEYPGTDFAYADVTDTVASPGILDGNNKIGRN